MHRPGGDKGTILNEHDRRLLRINTVLQQAYDDQRGSHEHTYDDLNNPRHPIEGHSYRLAFRRLPTIGPEGSGDSGNLSSAIVLVVGEFDLGHVANYAEPPARGQSWRPAVWLTGRVRHEGRAILSVMCGPAS